MAASLVILAALLQVATSPPFNLVLVAVVVSAAMLGAASGVVLACVGGLVLDLGSAGPVGLHALALLPAGWISGRWPRWFSVMAASLLYPALLLILYHPPILLVARIATYDSLLVLFAIVLVRLPALGRISRRAQA